MHRGQRFVCWYGVPGLQVPYGRRQIFTKIGWCMIMNNIGENINCLRLCRALNGSHPSSEIITSYEVPLIAPDTILPARFFFNFFN